MTGVNVKHAVILAAGEGQRLRPFTASKPKVMIRVANKPILEYVVEAVKEAGISNITIVVGYKKERIMDYFGDGSRWNVEIEYGFQDQQIGTAHALKQAESLIGGDFIVLPGDNLVDADTVRCAMIHPWCLVYMRLNEVSKYGAVVVKNDIVVTIIEKPKEPVSNLVNTGIYSFGEEIFGKIGAETSIISVINNLIKEGQEFRAVESNGKWLDIVYPWDILKVNDLALDPSGKEISGKVEENVLISGNVRIGENTVIRGNTYIRGPVVIGKGCDIGPNAVIMPSTSIGDWVSIGPFSILSNCVIADGVRISSGAHLEDSVIDSGSSLGSKFTALSGKNTVNTGDDWHEVRAGIFVGENCEVGSNTVSEPCTVVGNLSTISSLKTLRGYIHDGSTVL